MKRYGLTNDGMYWYTPDRRYFAYKHLDYWMVYEQEQDENGNVIEGGQDEDMCLGYSTLRECASWMLIDRPYSGERHYYVSL